MNLMGKGYFLKKTIYDFVEGVHVFISGMFNWGVKFFPRQFKTVVTRAFFVGLILHDYEQPQNPFWLAQKQRILLQFTRGTAIWNEQKACGQTHVVFSTVWNRFSELHVCYHVIDSVFSHVLVCIWPCIPPHVSLTSTTFQAALVLASLAMVPERLGAKANSQLRNSLVPASACGSKADL